MAPRVTPAAAAISWSVVRVTPWRAKTLRAATRMPRRVRSDSRFVLRKSKTQHLGHTFVIVYYTRALELNSQTRDDPAWLPFTLGWISAAATVCCPHRCRLSPD